MNKTLTASALALALTSASVTSSLAEGRETNISEQQVASAMVSTQSFPGSAAGSSAAGSAGPFMILTLVTLAVVIAATQGGGYTGSY